MQAVEFGVTVILAKVLANGTKAADIDPEMDLVTGYGLDSLQMISLLLGIEDAFDIELDYDHLALDDLRSVREFAAFVTGSVQANR